MGRWWRELPRQPGARETRWTHLVSGELVMAAAAQGTSQDAAGGDPLSGSEIAAMRAQIDQLQSEIGTLRETVARLCKELGITP